MSFQKPNGRPQRHFITEKPCKGCGRTFTMEDRGIKHPSWFSDVKYCSEECRQLRSKKPIPKSMSELRQFLLDNSKHAPNGCIEWTGRQCHNGYGVFTHAQREVRAHRVAYELSKGPIASDLMVLHSCDNRVCINPDHLRVGSALDNSRDCIARGRAHWQKSTTGTPGQQCSGDEQAMRRPNKRRPRD